MRKRVNILFVALATCSLAYGLVLRYSPESNNAIIQNDSPAMSKEAVNYDEDGVVDLDALEFSNPD